MSVASHQPAESQSIAGVPSVPPAIRRILQLPETPPPAPRRPLRFAPNGTRLPPGPPPPHSWLSSRSAFSNESSRAGGSHGPAVEGFQRHFLPGAYLPSHGSLVELTLRELASDWDFQRSYNHFYLYTLSSRLRTALITHLGIWHAGGVSLADLKAILLPAPEIEAGLEGGETTGDQEDFEDSDSLPPPSSMNEDIFHLDLTGSIGRSINLRELTHLLFPPESDVGEDGNLQESWDAPSSPGAVPRPLLPNLTHLSLAIAPQHASSVSWRQLLSFSSHLHTLTHLSLAYWPEPTLTPNARFTSVLSAQGRSIQYGGTSLYSHSLDDDWSEAALILRRLAKKLYRLEYLDLTGCSAWFPALMAVADHDTVDWVGDWGKISTLLLYPGYTPGGDSEQSEKASHVEAIDVGRRVEKHIRAKRAGRGRLITVETDRKPESS